jgi:alpha-mannosidase
MASKYPARKSDSKFQQKVVEALVEVKNFYNKYTNEGQQNTFKIFACGHCHIDTAWLWPYAETKRKIARSWSSQINFMKNIYPETGFKFSASSAAHYWWLEKNYPELFLRV